MPRLQELDPDNLTTKQKEVFDRITAGPRGGVRGPFVPMLLSPGVCDYIQGLGAYLRFDGVLPGKLRELAILTTARFWKADYEWNAHVPFAKKEGLDPAVIDAIGEGKTPDFTTMTRRPSMPSSPDFIVIIESVTPRSTPSRMLSAKKRRSN